MLLQLYSILCIKINFFLPKDAYDAAFINDTECFLPRALFRCRRKKKNYRIESVVSKIV